MIIKKEDQNTGVSDGIKKFLIENLTRIKKKLYQEAKKCLIIKL